MSAKNNQQTTNFATALTAEHLLLDFFLTQPSPAAIENFAWKNETNWPLYYHLSPLRTALLDWYSFNPHSHLLEIGAGCGAFTGFFCSRVSQVTTLEPDPARFPVLTARHQNTISIHSNLINFQAQSLHDHALSTDHTYDYITAIGVLEYAPQFYSSHISGNDLSISPALQFLTDVKKLLRHQGKFLLAIENRLGLKYWNGCTEDHTGEFFSSLENYPHLQPVETFSYTELVQLLLQAGFNHPNFYFPFPDYKLPQLILHSELLNNSHFLPSTLCELWADGWEEKERLNPFSSVTSAFFLQKENLFSQFAPSFLIELST